MQRARRAGQNDTGAARIKALGLGHHTQKGQSSGHRNPGQSGKTRQTAANRVCRAISESMQRTQRNQRCVISRGARAGLVKKKDQIGLKGPLRGHFKPETRETVANIIKESIAEGISCTISPDYGTLIRYEISRKR